jgi:hypothetical protein
MHMKYFVVPEPISMLNTVTKKPLTYGKDHPQEGENVIISAHRFILDNICANKDIGKGVEAIRRVRKLDMALEDTKAGDIVGIEDADYTVIMKIMSEMEFQSPVHAAQLLPFFEAWENTAKQDEEWKKKQNLKAVPDAS